MDPNTMTDDDASTPFRSTALPPTLSARMSDRPFLSKMREWFLRTSAMREARAAAAGPDGLRSRAQAQAQLLAEVARRVAEPIEALPPGSRAAVQLGLSRDATYWALVALQQGETAAPDLPTLWNEVPAERIEQAAGGPDAAERVRRTLADGGPAHLLEVSDEDAGRARKFADALVMELDAPRRRIERIQFQRWWRLTMVAVLVMAAAYGVHLLALGPNLIAGKPFRTSSQYGGCSASSPCEGIFFHTEQENNPWIEFDLGAEKPVKRVEVANRSDCCDDRAIPLIIELSNDRTKWTEVARRDTEFQSWTAKFPSRKARYVRLRVPRPTQFHLKEVVVR
jgi:hypothetical protein